ncbi:MAG TPA: hypothetical protein VK203_30755 [Nostocaceae cyanobacterium]|nr:hypothetical protein [Nostocaceae cyanobacterium]
MKVKFNTSIKRNQKLFNQLLFYVSLPLALGIFQNSAKAVTLTGDATYFYQSSTGTVAPVYIDLGFGPVSTGEVSYSIDLTKPKNQTFNVNFDTKTVTVEIDYLLSFPLLQQIGRPPIRVHVSESGPLLSAVPDLPIGQAQSLKFDALVIGGGTAGPDTILPGLKYTTSDTITVSTLVDVEVGGIFKPTKNVIGNINVTEIKSTITVPGGSPQVTTGIGRSTLATTPVPEPDLLNPLGAAIVLGALLSIKNRQKNQINCDTLHNS